MPRAKFLYVFKGFEFLGSGDTEEVEILRAEVRKLRTIKDQLLQEKEELFQNLREKDRVRREKVVGSDAVQSERLREVERSQAEEIAALERELAVAMYNQQDLLHNLQSSDGARVRPSGMGVEAGILSKLSNLLVLEISNLTLHPNQNLWPDDYPTTFLSIDFYAHETQVTYPATGLDVNVGWSCEFEVEVDNLFIEYLDRKTFEVELMQRVNQDVPFHRVAVADVSLRSLLERPSLTAQRVELVAKTGGRTTAGYVVGIVTLNARMVQPLSKAVEKYRNSHKQAGREPRASEGVVVKAGLPADVKLAVTIEYVEGVRAGRFGRVPWPYVQYDLPVEWAEEEGHVTKTVKEVVNGMKAVFNDTKVWELRGEDEVESLRKEELEVFVFDDNELEGEEDDASYLGSATVKLAPLFLPNQRYIQASVDLRDPSGRTNGALSIRLEWRHPSLQAARPSGEVERVQSDDRPRVRAGRKLKAETDKKEEGWLEQLRESFSTSGHTSDQAFLSFDRDGDGEVSFADFEETMAGQPLKITSQESLQLFEYWAGGKNKNISRNRFKQQLDGDVVVSGNEEEQLVIIYGQLSVKGTSSIFEGLSDQIAIVTDWFAQAEEDEMKVIARKIQKRAAKAYAEVNAKAVYDMSKRRHRARVEAVMQKDGKVDGDEITVMICTVGTGGAVDTGNWLAKGSLDIRDVRDNKEELTEFSLQLLDQNEKPCADLTIDTKMIKAVERLKVGGVGAVPEGGARANWEEKEAGRLAKKLADKGMSTKEAFRRFDENCDGDVDYEEFEAAIQGERMDLKPADIKRLFNYLSNGRDAIELKSWDEKLRLGAVVEAAGAVGAGEDARGNVVVIVKEVSVKPEAWKRLGGREGNYAGFKSLAVEVDFLKQPVNEALPTTKRYNILEGEKTVQFNDKIVVPLSGGRDDGVAAANRQRALALFKQSATARAGPPPGQIEVILVGYRDKDSKDGVELGKAQLDLKSLWDDGEDLASFSLQVQKDDGAVGTVQIGVFFMQALQNLNIKGGAGAGDAKGLSDPSSGSRAPAPPAARRGAEAAAPRERGRGGGRGGGAGVGQSTDGSLAVEVTEVELFDRCEVMREDKASKVFVMVNFFGAQTEREVEKEKSVPISRDALRDQAQHIKFSCELPVNSVQNSANLELLKGALVGDEDDKTGLLSVLVGRAPYAGEYTSKASETVEVGKGHVSVCDALHYLATGDKDLDGTVDVPIYSVTAKEEVGRVIAKVVFKQLELDILKGRVFQEEEKAKHVMVQVRWVRLEGQDWKTKLFKAVRSVSIAIQLQGDKSWLEPHSRKVLVRDSGGDRKFRGALMLNHTFELPLQKHAELRDALLDGLKTEVTLLLLDTSTSETRVLGTAKRDLRRMVDERTDREREEVELMDTTGSKIGRAQVDFAVVKAVSTLQAPAKTDSAGAGGLASDFEKMSVRVDRVELLGGEGSVLEESKAVKVYATAKWFGHEAGSSSESRPLPKSVSVPLEHTFTLALSDPPPKTAQGFREWRNLVGSVLSSSLGASTKQSHVELQVWWQGARNEQERIGVGVIDLNKTILDHAEGEFEVPLVSDPSSARSRQVGTIHVQLSALAALTSVPFRSPKRQPPPSPDEENALVIKYLEGVQVASAQEKEGNFVVCVKSMDLTTGSLTQKGRRSGPVFVAVNLFSTALTNQDVAACSGGDAKLKQKRVELGERFLFGISSAQKANRNAIKSQLDKQGPHGVEIEIFLMSEPWAQGDNAWAEGFLSLADCADKDGQDILVNLTDCEDRDKRGSVVVQVYVKEAMKRLGKA